MRVLFWGKKHGEETSGYGIIMSGSKAGQKFLVEHEIEINIDKATRVSYNLFSDTSVAKRRMIWETKVKQPKN